MKKEELGRVEKNNITFVEYAAEHPHADQLFFVQCGIAGFYLNKKELEDLSCVLNYYINIENYSECRLKIEGEYVAIQ